MGPIPYIGLDTRYARIIADTVEAGLGIRTALANVNAPWPGVKEGTIAKWKAAAATASTDVPVAVDYRKEPNPYLARYGSAGQSRGVDEHEEF